MPEHGLFVHSNTDGSGTSPGDGRKAIAGLLAPAGAFGGRPGVLSGMVVSGTSGWNYAVGPGHVATPADAGELVVWANSAAAIVATSGAPGTGSRVDVVWARHTRRAEGSAVSEPEFGVVQGVASTGTPVVPALPFADAIEIGRKTVAAGDGSTSAGAAVSYGGTSYTASRGAPIPVPNVTQRNLISWASLSNPALVYRLDTGAIEINRGSGWSPIAQGAWTSYTPALGGSPDPILGSGGVADGEFCVIDKTVHYRFNVTFGGSGLQVGGGTYTLSLPVPASSTGSSRVYGFAHASDAGTGGELFTVRGSSSSTSLVVFTRTSSAATPVSSSTPWVWAEGDSIRGMITYPAA